MPVEVRITASSVGEKSKLEVAFADANLTCARPGSASDRPRSIFMCLGGAMDGRQMERGACLGKAAHRRLRN
jgi:hypothetical protein